MKKRITDNTRSHGFAINQIVKVDRIDNDGTYKSNGWYFDNDDCEDFDDYKPGDKIRIKQDTHLHGQTGNLVTITNLTEGYCADGSRSYMTDSGTYIPERDFDCYEGEIYVNKQEETKTMKYKIGDKVKIVACKHGHGFDIGEVVVITEITDDDDYRAEYLDGHDFWYVHNDEIEPVNNIITRPHDYTGCDPEIAEALKQGLDVYCEVWDDDEDPKLGEWLTQYLPSRTCRYWGEGMYWKHARPIRQEPVQETKPKTKLVPKPASEIFAWLENPENGYFLDEDGDYSTEGEEPSFVMSMLKHCGTDDCKSWNWHPEWLREVPVEPQVSENSENLPQTATVIHKSNYQLLPGQKVTVIKSNEAGNFLCESDTGSQIWMRPDQLKFD